jgi:hypothetical protein
MRTTALLVAVLALSAAPVRAEDGAPPQRGFLSGLGIGLLVAGLGGMGAGVAGMATANDGYGRLTAYTGTVSADERPTVTALQQQVSGGTVLAGLGFGLGGAALVGGIVCLVLDRPVPSVAFVPTAQGGVLVFSGHF